MVYGFWNMYCMYKFIESLSWLALEYACSSMKEVNENKRLWKIVPRKYHKIWRTTAQWTVVGEATNWLTKWITYIISEWVIVRYTKLSIIVWYKVTSMEVSIILLSVILVCSRISITYFD
jgi:hypothetical protein